MHRSRARLGEQQNGSNAHITRPRLRFRAFLLSCHGAGWRLSVTHSEAQHSASGIPSVSAGEMTSGDSGGLPTPTSAWSGSPAPVPASGSSKQNTSMSLLANLDALMSPEKVKTANDLRRQMWTGGLTGLTGGIAAALVSFAGMKRVPSLQRYTHKNYIFAAVLCSGSLGSFLGAVVNGKNAMQMSVVSHAPKVTPHDESFLRRQESIIAAQKAVASSSPFSKKSF